MPLLRIEQVRVSLAVILPLVILPLVVGYLRWVEKDVFPSMWVTGEIFDMPPTRGERAAQKLAGAGATLCACLWWLLVLALSLKSVS